MGSGYHSRSPEELRQYLDSFNRKTPRRNWIQYIIFGNIIVVMFVIFVLLQDKSLGIGSSFKVSNKIQVNNQEAYFTKSNETITNSVTYFLFVKNTLPTEGIFPPNEMQVLFTLTTEDKEECLQKKIGLNPKTISSNNTEFYSFSINENEINKTDTCDKFFHKTISRNTFSLLSKKNIRFTPELNLIYNNQIYRMSIQN